MTNHCKTVNAFLKVNFGRNTFSLKQLQILNQHHLFTPRQVIAKINRDYIPVLNRAKANIKKYRHNILIEHGYLDNISSMNLTVSDKVGLKDAEAQYNQFNHYRHQALRPIKHYFNRPLLHANGFRFTPATIKQIERAFRFHQSNQSRKPRKIVS